MGWPARRALGLLALVLSAEGKVGIVLGGVAPLLGEATTYEAGVDASVRAAAPTA